ncbi:hypothetical protein EV363DRAFT_1492351 [Boletus edulis]|nr:hypothetical protein EV363DRAFT_1492351 [Boletus edulis]
MSNSLARTAGLKLGPVALDILLKHYFDRLKKEKTEDRFFDVATHHPVEELQAFSNTRTPSPPWVHVVRVTVPMSCCDEAATLLIQVLGGEEHVFLLVGGTKWWQVRGVTGIAGEWVTAKKDWEGAKKRRKAFQKMKTGNSGSSQDAADAMPSSTSEPSNIDDKDADRLPLYIMGARRGLLLWKSRSGEMPAPCGTLPFSDIVEEDQRPKCSLSTTVWLRNIHFLVHLQQLGCSLYGNLYLIKHPPEAPHQHSEHNQHHIVVAGASSRRWTLLLSSNLFSEYSHQYLPRWSLDSSFHSMFVQTHGVNQDVIPLYGLSIHKPSALWPPPSEEMTRRIHTGLRRKIRQIVRATITGNKAGDTAAPEPTRDRGDDERSVSSDMPIDVGATASIPRLDEKDDQTISLADQVRGNY